MLLFLIHHLTLWQRADEPRRAGRHGRQQVHFAAAGCATVPLGQVRHHPAPQLQVHRRRRPEERL